MTSEVIDHQSQGVHAGGRLAASIRLFDRIDGSFLNPGPSATAEHCIEFWSGVDIPDEIIDQVVAAYAKNRKDEIDADMDQAMVQWRTRWEEQNPVPKERHLPEYQERFKAEHEQYRLSILPGIVAKRPERLGQYDTRQLIRTTKMLINRPHTSRFPGEGDKVLAEKIELFDEDLTVLDIERKYRLTQVRHAMEKVFTRDHDALLEALEIQRQELVGIREQLVYLRSDMSDS